VRDSLGGFADCCRARHRLGSAAGLDGSGRKLAVTSSRVARLRGLIRVVLMGRDSCSADDLAESTNIGLCLTSTRRRRILNGLMADEGRRLREWIEWIDEVHDPRLRLLGQPPEVGDQEQLALGRSLLGLRAPGRGYEWITRRFDTIDFPDWARQQRTTRLEVDLRPMLVDDSAYPLWSESLLVPVTTMPRGQHRTITVTDEAGTQLVKLSGLHERRLLTLGLLDLAVRRISLEVPRPVVQHLARSVAGLEDDDPLADFPGPYRSFRRALRGDPAFLSFYELVRDYSDLIALLPVPTATRRMFITTVTQEQHRLGRSTRRQRAGRLLSPKPREYIAYTVTRKQLDARSYHIEINAPYDLEIPSAELAVFDTPEQRGTHMPQERLPSDSPDRTSAHVNRPGTERVVDSGLLVVEMVPCPTGVVRSSVASVGLIAATLIAGSIYVWVTPIRHVHTVDRASTTSLLLLAPALLAVLLVAPSQHSLTTRFLLGTRFTVVLACLLLFVAAVSVALELAALVPLWTALSAIGSVLAGRLLYEWTWLMTRRRRGDAERRRRSSAFG
jgi:hypothetical protein